MPASKEKDPAERPPERGERVAVALGKRLPVLESGKEPLRKAFPGHWSFLLGEIALYSFAALVLTGVHRTFFFRPGMREVPCTGPYVPLQGVRMSEAYASVMRISFDVRGGLLNRQIHHWGAIVAAGGYQEGHTFLEDDEAEESTERKGAATTG